MRTGTATSHYLFLLAFLRLVPEMPGTSQRFGGSVLDVAGPLPALMSDAV